MEPQYTKAEERMNWLTHGIGVVLSIGGLVVLIIGAAIYGTASHIVSFTIYGSTLIILYTISTLYHFVTHIKVKKVLRVLDHSAIFVLIAGTYTPFVLVCLSGGWGWSIFGIIWLYAILGIIMASFFIDSLRKMSVAVYLAMGWLCLVAAKEIIADIPHVSIVLLLTGGLIYTLGIVFFAWRTLPYNHGLWHLCVLAGSVIHYFSVLLLLRVV
jgi:hemolysin III